MTKRRITIMLDSELLTKLRIIQSKQIRETNNSVSLSKVIDGLLTKATKR